MTANYQLAGTTPAILLNQMTKRNSLRHIAIYKLKLMLRQLKPAVA